METNKSLIGGQLDWSRQGELAKALIDCTPVAFIILNREYQIQYINQNFAKLRKLDPSAVVGDMCYNISNNGQRCKRCVVRQTLETGQKAKLSRKDVLTDGTVRYIDDYSIPLQMDAQGNVEYVLEMMVDRTAEMIMRERRNQDYGQMLALLSTLLESKDTYTAQHSDSVRRLAVGLAHAMGLSAEEVFEISVAASLHDIGKVTVPESIINKPDRLTPEEYNLIKTHSEATYNMLQGFSSLGNIRRMARHHHERVDGTGYPDGLAGDNISLGARIIAVADTYDAITSTRSYREALSHEYAMEEITRAAGSQLDEQVVQAFLAMDFNKGVEEDLPQGTLTTTVSQVERLVRPMEHHEEHHQPLPLGSQIDLNRLLGSILDNTPCGYMVTNEQHEILFTNQFLLDYLGTNADQLLGQMCYRAVNKRDTPCIGCDFGTVSHGGGQPLRRQVRVGEQEKTYDLIQVPLQEETSESKLIINIILDRTEESNLERTRRKEFQQLVGLLSEILREQGQNLLTPQLIAQIMSLEQEIAGLEDEDWGKW